MSLYRIARAAQGDLDEIWCHIGAFDLRAADHWLDGGRAAIQGSRKAA